MTTPDARNGQDGTVTLVRNVLALLVSSAVMALVGLMVLSYEFDSGPAALAGTLVLLAGLVAAVGLAVGLLGRLELLAARLVAAWRS
jgi:hypothetical protein